jgi:hypothetical protein
MSKYMLLIYTAPDGRGELSPDEQAAITDEYMAIAAAPTTTGGAELDAVSTARSVRVPNGKPVVTDGPFAETKEILAGYYIVDVESSAEAEAIAAKVPAARFGGTVEVRPVVTR